MLASPIGPPRPPSLRPDSGPTVGPDWPHDCPPHDAIRASSHEHEMPIETAPGPRAAELDAALFARPPCRPSPEILAQLAHDAGSAPSLPTRQVAAAGQAAAASWRHQKHPFSIRLALQAVVACLVSSSREPRCPPQSRIDRHDDPLSLSLSPADRPGPPPISPLTVLAAVIGLGLGLAYLYRAALPKPLPGIPYNKDSARRLFGDVKAIRQSTYRRRWIWSQPRLHRSPISQAFLFPFRRPTVIVSDYRTAVDICSRRIKEFDRGTRNRECVGLTAPNFHFTMQSSDPRLKRHRDLLRDLMTPCFLKDVVAPRIYDRAALLVDLWTLKQSRALARPFAADHDLSLATLDMISSAAFGMEKSNAALTKEILCVQCFRPDAEPGPVDFPRATQGPEIEGLLDIADMVAVAQGSPFPTLAQWLALLKPKHARAHWHRRKLLRRQTAKSLHRLARVGEKVVSQSALDELLRREKMAAAKAGRAPDFYSPAIRDEVLGYLLGGHDTTSTLLAWWVKYMTRHQDVQARLRSAIRQGHSDALAEGRWPTMTEIVSASIPYLDAVLEESLRCASVATLIVRKATRDTQILGYSVPEGTDVIIPLTGPSFTEPALDIPESLRSEACRNARDRVPAWGDDVGEFRPQRWLKDETGAAGETVEAFDPQAGPSLAFSSGPRQCFGRKQAYLQLRTTVTLLLWSFAFDPVDEALDGWEITESLVNLPKVCYVQLRKL